MINLSGNSRVRNDHSNVVLTKQISMTSKSETISCKVKKSSKLGLIQSMSGKICCSVRTLNSKFTVIVSCIVKIVGFGLRESFKYIHESINSVISINGPPRIQVKKLYPSVYFTSRNYLYFIQKSLNFFNLDGGYTSI